MEDFMNSEWIDKHCMGCYYYKPLNCPEMRCCNYIFMTGHKRPCDPGKDCTVKVKNKRPKGRKPKNG